MSRRIESLFIPGPAGRLEALLEAPARAEPAEIALVCHPHPLHGGTLHNKVVHRLARALRSTGAATLRFNFRGVNLSQGQYDHGAGEIDDARAALAFLLQRFPSLPLTVAGFSFGSRVAAHLHGGARRVILAGFPTTYRQSSYLRACPVERIFIHSTNDEFGPKAELDALVASLWGPKRLIYIDAPDHFFSGALDPFERAVASL